MRWSGRCLLAEAEAEEVVGLVALQQDGRAAQGGGQVEQRAFVVEQEMLVENVVPAQQRHLPDDQPALLHPVQERAQHRQRVVEVLQHMPQRGDGHRSGLDCTELPMRKEA